MSKEWFESRYLEMIRISNNYTILDPVLLTVHEFTTCIPEEGDVAYEYVKRIEQDLFEMGVLPFKVESLCDERKILKVSDSYIQKILRCLLTALRHVSKLSD